MKSLFKTMLLKDKTNADGKTEVPREIKIMFNTMLIFALSVEAAVVFEFAI
jgi:hypothetical protein